MYEEQKPIAAMPGSRSGVPNSTLSSCVRVLEGVQDIDVDGVEVFRDVFALSKELKAAPHGSLCRCVDVRRDHVPRVRGALGALGVLIGVYLGERSPSDASWSSPFPKAAWPRGVDGRQGGVLGARRGDTRGMAPGCRPTARWLVCGYPSEPGRQRRA